MRGIAHQAEGRIMSFFISLACGIAAVLSYMIARYLRLSNIATFLAFVIPLIVGGIVYFVQPSVQQSAADTNTIIVGVSGDFPPFTFLENGTVIGFDVDLIKEIGKRLNKNIEIKNMPFNTLLGSLQMGTLQVIASGLTATPERAQHVLFTTPYLENNQLVMVSLSKAPAHTIDELRDKEVVVNEGYTADMYVSAIQGPIIHRLKTPAEAFLALKSGRAFAFVTADNTVKPFFAQYGTSEFHVAPIPGTEENASLAIAPHYPQLRDELQSALDSMKADGTLQSLKTKWGL